MVKPISVATQINNSQTQCTEQTFEFDTAVKTEHIASTYIEDLLVLLIPISLELFEALTCYNTFLKYYNLTPLKSDQTIRSFIKHLKGLKFNKPTRFSINKQLNEAYIYLPCNNNILSNHIPLNLFTLSQYYNTPLRTFTNLIIPNFDDNLNISNPTTNFSNNFNSQTITNNDTNNTNNSLSLNIVTHNVRGYNNPLKKQLWEDFCLSHNYNIISLTETKLTNSKSKYFNTQHFTYYLSNSTSSVEGTGIMLSNNLTPHIHKILKHEGGAISIDLFFKHDFKFRIISVYLSSTDISRRNSTQTKGNQ